MTCDKCGEEMSDNSIVSTCMKCAMHEPEAVRYIKLIRKDCGIKDCKICIPLRKSKPKREALEIDDELGFWMSAALEDHNTCDKLKDVIRRWFDSFDWTEVHREKEDEKTTNT